jgi:hypothetical protein
MLPTTLTSTLLTLFDTLEMGFREGRLNPGRKLLNGPRILLQKGDGLTMVAPT